MRVLLSANVCAPGRGSEPGIGWGWATSLAEAGCDVVVLVPAPLDGAVADELTARPRDRLAFEPVRIPRVRLPGLRPYARQALQYVAWQVAAYRAARRLQRTRPFDVVHHVTFGSLPGGSLMGRLPIPFVFGPVGGGQVAEPELEHWFGATWRTERARTALTRRTTLLPLARSAARRSSIVLAVNDDTAALASRLGASQIVPALDGGLEADFAAEAPELDGVSQSTSGALRLLWVGRAMPRKGLNLAVRAFDAADLPDATLVVAGDGPCLGDAERLVDELGCGARVELRGAVPFGAMRSLYRASDLFLFTSLRDSFGTQLLEAAAFGLPLVILDHHGAGDRVPDAAAHKVPIASPDELVASLASALRMLADDAPMRQRMGAAARTFALEHRWSVRARAMIAMYERVLDAPPRARLD